MTVAHEEPNYMGVFWWLLVLTILEICVIYAPMAHLAIVLLLIVMALTKASLVAMFYMHLALEKRTLGIIALTPLVLCVFLIFALTPDLAGGIWVADFIFTRCGGMCPALTTTLAAFLRRLPPSSAERLRAVTFTVDPEHDDPATLRRYAEGFGADRARWLFVTGDRGDV